MLSVIIPNLDSPIIDKVVASIQAQTAHDAIREIIVVGQDRHALVPADVTFLRTEKPVSAAVARNLGAKHAMGELLLFVDADCLMHPTTVERLLPCHTKRPRAVCGGISPEGQSYWTRCDNLLVFADFLSTSPPGTREFLPSLNFSLPRELFLHVGGFDETFPGAAGEDLDLSLRLREAGHELYFEPHASIAHHHRRTSRREVWEHLRSFGRIHVRVARTRPALQASRILRLPMNSTALIMAAALPLACLDMIGLFATRPALHPYLSALPGMAWAKAGWYWGVAEGLGTAVKAQ